MIVPMTKAQLAVLLAAAIAAPAAVNAHGSMSLPKPTFAIQGDTTQFGLTVDSSALTAPSGMSFTTDPESNTKAFTAALKASSYKSVKELVAAKGQPIAGANKECGLTSATGAKQPLPAQVEWSHGSGEGFTPSHQGPCEVWCDNVLAFSDDNCAKNYPAAPAKLPYDKSKCAGKSVLKTIWLALHSPTWQAYINCAAIEGGSSSGGDSSGSTPAATSKAPATTSKAPSVTPKPGSSSTKTPKPAATTAPATGGEYDDEDCEDELPVAGDEDCDDDLDIKDTPAPAAGGNNGGSSSTPKPATSKPTTSKPATGGSDNEYPGGEVGGDADDDCDDELPIAGEEDCDDELPIAGEEDCDDELDIADEKKTSVRTTDIEFDMLSPDDDVAAPVDY